MSVEEHELINKEIDDFLNNKVIERAQHEQGEFISNIFLRPKPDGRSRIILDLTKLNQLVEYKHFKMFSLNTALDLITPHAWMGSVDLKQAYFSIPIAKEHRKYLRFIWNNCLFEFTCLPNGLSACPRIFTMLLKPIFAKLSDEGFIMFPYIDDSFVIAESEQTCKSALEGLCKELNLAGFTIHDKKSVLIPTKKLKFLGFNLDSEKMEVSLTGEKVEKFIKFANQIREAPRSLKIRKVAVLLGLMTAYSQGLQYGAAHIKGLEIDKNLALINANGNFERFMTISKEGWDDIDWWIVNIRGQPKAINSLNTAVQIATDASLQGWGACKGGHTAGGRWLQTESDDHINALELKAIWLALNSLTNKEDKQIELFTDNMTALAYIRRMGGTRSVRCNELARKIWRWAEQRGIWLTINYIPGKLNTIADAMSRQFQDHLEWSLSSEIFEEICKIWGVPDIDLFASRNNYKLSKYVSWLPEPEAWKVDAFSFRWSNSFFYVFPPFSMVGRVIRKLHLEKTSAVLVTPAWTTQPWLAAAKSWAREYVTFRAAENNLLYSGPLEPGGNVSSTPLVVFRFCGNT